MQVDTQSIIEFGLTAHMFWSGPFRLVLVFITLWFYIGWATFVGLGTFFLMIPFYVVFSAQINKVQAKLIKIKDERIKMLNEILNGIKVNLS